MKHDSVSTKQERIAELARMNPAMAFNSLNQYLDYKKLYYAYAQTRKDGRSRCGWSDGGRVCNQPGAESPEPDRPHQIRSLPSAASAKGTISAKSDGGQRGLGIPSFEDEVAQWAISMLLEPIYEDCSYGFRPGRNAHQALQAA